MKRRHFGNIRKLASGRWQVRYQGLDGRMRPGERTFASKADAQRYLTDVEHRLHAGTWLDPKARAELLSVYAAKWIKNRDISPRTRDLYQDLLKLHIAPQLGGMPIGAISPAEVRDWHAGRLGATGPQRTRQAYSLLRTIMGTAVKDGLLTLNPCQIKGAGSTKSPERPYMSKQYAAALIDAMPEHMQTPALVTLLCHLRRGELLGLRRSDVDLEAGTLHIQRAVSRPREGGPIERRRPRQASPGSSISQMRPVRRYEPTLPLAKRCRRRVCSFIPLAAR